MSNNFVYPYKNTYVGRRYVPKMCGDWDNGLNTQYEALSVVQWQGTSYTSKIDVPKGIDIGNTTYWVISANYNQQVENYHNDVVNYQIESDQHFNAINTQINEIIVQLSNFNPHADGVTDDISSLQSAINYIQTNGSSGVILLDKKTYFISNFTFPDNISLVGNGVETIIKSDGTLTFGNNSYIDNLYLTTKTPMIKNTDGFQPYPTPSPNPSNYTALAFSIYFHNVKNVKASRIYGDGVVVTFDNVDGFEFKNNNYKGGYSVCGGFETFNNTKNGNIENNEISYSSSNGFGCHTASFLRFTKNNSHHNGMSGFYTPYCTDLTISQNQSHDHKYFDGFDINTSADTGFMSTPSRIKLLANESYNNFATGFYITGSQNIITGNIAHDNGTNGIRIVAWGSDVTKSTNNIINDNIVYNNNKNLNSNGLSLTHNMLLTVDHSNIQNNQSIQSIGAIERCLYIVGENNNIVSNMLYDLNNPDNEMLFINAVPSGAINNVISNRISYNNVSTNSNILALNNKITATYQGDLIAQRCIATGLWGALGNVSGLVNGAMVICEDSGTTYLVVVNSLGQQKKVALT